MIRHEAIEGYGSIFISELFSNHLITSTPTRIAYSVVPCPFLHASFAFADAWRLWAMQIARVRTRADDGAETQDAPSRGAAGER